MCACVCVARNGGDLLNLAALTNKTCAAHNNFENVVRLLCVRRMVSIFIMPLKALKIHTHMQNGRLHNRPKMLQHRRAKFAINKPRTRQREPREQRKLLTCVRNAFPINKLTKESAKNESSDNFEN